MKIGVVGSGIVGRVLATGLIGCGHEVMIGTREPERADLVQWRHAHEPHASTGSFAGAAKFGELIVLATLGSATQDVIEMAGAANFDGKVVIDATNPLVFYDDAPPGLSVGWNDSRGEQVQRWLPGARVVKAFNIVGNADMVKPEFPCGPPDMFIAGNDSGAKAVVTGILHDFGWNVIDIGGIEGARVLEPLCLLWVNYAISHKSRDHAFKLLHR
ncbi:MAG: NAD(P)-binding domain-containing protein [Candidatus Eremiobacteraeota bacterium]|nr:NAD(P)-binding domain-containing protein [Candidatus Eremiobacteraeota bacterium]MBV8223132.1 NAD(P)-binding domain-containing protein [Candidatus Eremiobacteraeota bacterium]